MTYADRHIPLVGAKNFRDFGGYITADGNHVKTGVLFRSDVLAELTADDFNKIAPLGIRNICDLRRDNERGRAPTNWVCDASVKHRHMPLLTSKGEHTLEKLVTASGASRSPEAAREFMVSIYLRLIGEPQARQYFRQLFELLAHPDELPLLIHCTAGKDRTGVSCALILWVLGVSKEDILQDYMLSQPLYSERVDILKLSPQMFDHTVIENWEEDSLRPIFSAEPAYLEAMFEFLHQSHDSPQHFFVDTLGLSEDVLARVRHNLLEK